MVNAPLIPGPANSRSEFATASRIVFGPGVAAELPTIVAALGSRVLVCTGSDPARHRKLLDTLRVPMEILTAGGEPTVESAREGVRRCTEFDADVVVGLGGGSSIDLAKAIAMLQGNGGDPVDYLEVVGRGQPITRPSVPTIAVPTTAGSGAEVTANAVLAAPEHNRKVSLRAASMLPAVALVDPLLTLGCGPGVTAASGLDALTQCLEPFVSPMATPFSDLYAADGLQRVGRALRAVHHTPGDVDARAEMSLVSLFGGLALANAKLGAVHGIAGVIGGLVAAPHGAICAALLVPVTKLNVRLLRERDPEGAALHRYGRAAQLLTGDPTATIDDGLDWIRATVTMLGIPDLAGLGVPTLEPGILTEIATMAAAASSTRGNPVRVTPAELRDCLEAS